jgi:hypothetical protein
MGICPAFFKKRSGIVPDRQKLALGKRSTDAALSFHRSVSTDTETMRRALLGERIDIQQA